MQVGNVRYFIFTTRTVCVHKGQVPGFDGNDRKSVKTVDFDRKSLKNNDFDEKLLKTITFDKKR